MAIKILRADVFPADTGRGAVDAARLVREAQAVAKLSHPNVVTIYDVGNVARGTVRVFLAMELVEGETLAAWLDRKRQTREEILRVFALAGRGLAAAHRAGTVAPSGTGRSCPLRTAFRSSSKLLASNGRSR